MEQVLIHFRLVGDEARALRALSIQETRHPRDQARHILRRELERRGLLPAHAGNGEKQQETEIQNEYAS